MDKKGFAVTVGNIYDFHCDAIVLPCPTNLKLQGSVAKHFKETIHPDTQKEIDEKKFLRLGTCAIFRTRGTINSPYVILTANPMNDGSDRATLKTNLKLCVKEILRLAIRCHLTSIAIPLLSAGFYGYKKVDALRGILDACVKSNENFDEKLFITVVLADQNTFNNNIGLFREYGYEYVPIRRIIDVDDGGQESFGWYTKKAFKTYYAPATPEHFFSFIEDRRILYAYSRTELCEGIMSYKTYSRLLQDHSHKIRKGIAILLGLKLEVTKDQLIIMLKAMGHELDLKNKDSIVAKFYLGKATFNECANYYKNICQ